MTSVSHPSFGHNQKLLVIKTLNGNKLLAKFNKDTDTVGDALHTVRNIMKVVVNCSGENTGYRLAHESEIINNETLLDTISSNLICHLKIVTDEMAKQAEQDRQVKNTPLLKEAKLHRLSMENLKTNGSRNQLRSWAKENKQFGVNGNSKSSDIKHAISERFHNYKQVFVKTLTGKTVTCDMTNDSYIIELMEQVKNKEGIPHDQQRIVYAGCQLETFAKLSDIVGHDIKETTIHLVLRLRGGMYDEKSGRNGHYEPISSLENLIFEVQKATQNAEMKVSELIDLISEPSC